MLLPPRTQGRPLDDLEGAVHRQVLEGLYRLARGPGHGDGLDRPGLAQADRGDEAVAAEAGTTANHAVDPAKRAVGLLHFDLDPGPDRRAVALGPHQLELDPMVIVARVLEQDVVCLVAGRLPA